MFRRQKTLNRSGDVAGEENQLPIEDIETPQRPEEAVTARQAPVWLLDCLAPDDPAGVVRDSGARAQGQKDALATGPGEAL